MAGVKAMHSEVDLAVYVDDLNMVGVAKNIQPMWKLFGSLWI